MRRKCVLCVLVLVALLYSLTVLVELNHLSLGVEDAEPSSINAGPSAHSRLCQPTQPSCSTPHSQTPRRVIIAGALSFIGSRLAAHLAANGLTVYGFASISDTRPEEGVVWYRKQQLAASGVAIEIIDSSNQTQLERKLLTHLSEDTLIVYVPTMDSATSDSQYNSQKAEEFVRLLELARKRSPCTEVMLISDLTETTALHRTWTDTFELLLSSYHSVYSVPMTVLRVSGVYGPWSDAALSWYRQLASEGPTVKRLELCWYINDVVDVLYRAIARSYRTNCEVFDLGSCLVQYIPLTAMISELQLDGFTTAEFVRTQDTIYSWTKLKIDKNQLYSNSKGVMKSLSWAKAFESSRGMVTRNIVLTSYFTSEVDAQRGRHKQADRFTYISDWYKSVGRLGMSAVVFHDGLGPEFQHKLTQYHPGVSFEYVSSLNGRSTNDARFYSYLKYLEHHPDIHRVLLTDVSDVVFQMDPFKLMDVLGEWLYIGTDIDIFPNMETMPWMHERLANCFGNYSVERGPPLTLTQMSTVYNAGVIGGSRDLMLTVLARVVAHLNNTPPQLNCNMPAVNIAVHKHFFEHVFTGYPLTSRFLRRQVSPQGVFILHK